MLRQRHEAANERVAALKLRVDRMVSTLRDPEPDLAIPSEVEQVIAAVRRDRLTFLSYPERPDDDADTTEADDAVQQAQIIITRVRARPFRCSSGSVRCWARMRPGRQAVVGRPDSAAAGRRAGAAARLDV